MNDMNDSNNSGDKTLSVQPSKTLSLKRPVEQGVVRQSFSHGRSKAVVVEKVKRRPHIGEASPVTPRRPRLRLLFPPRPRPPPRVPSRSPPPRVRKPGSSCAH